MFKTEVLTFSLKPALLPIFSILVNGSSIHSVAEAKNLRVILESSISFTPSKTSSHQQALLIPSSKYIPHQTTSYYLLTSLPASTLVQVKSSLSNTMIFYDSKSNHIPPLIKTLSCFPIMLRITFQFLAIAYMIWPCQPLQPHFLLFSPLHALL